MSSLREKFISFLQLRGFTKATVRNYLQAMKQFQDWLGKSPIHMNQEDARRYLSYLKNVKRLAPRTMNIHLYALKRFCEFFLPDSVPFRHFRLRYVPVFRQGSAPARTSLFWERRRRFSSGVGHRCHRQVDCVRKMFALVLPIPQGSQ